jgi:ABC-2 type transport system permease protein
MSTESLRRLGLLVKFNVLLRLRDPGQLVSYIVLPMVLMVVFKPLYVRTLAVGTIEAVAGPLVMFSVFCVAIVGGSFLVEREWHTWDRLRASKAGRAELLLGKALPILLILILQQSVLILFGWLVLGMPFPPSLVYLGLAIVVWGFTLLAIGSAAATVVRSRGELGMISDLGSMLISAVGGCLLPVSLMPLWAQHLSRVSPGYWALSMLRAALQDHPSAMVLPAIVCLSIGLITATFAIRRLSRGWGRSRLI